MCTLREQIKSHFITNLPSRIHQGDLLQNVKISTTVPIKDSDRKICEVIEFNFPYMVVISQDCDLKQYFVAKQNSTQVFNQYLSNLLLVPCFLKEDFKEGNNLSFLELKQERHSSDQMKRILQGREPRYHYLAAEQTLKIPELFIDFKICYTIHPDVLFATYPTSYVATVNALFREHLTQRYSNYISRIGLPDLQ